MSYVNLNAIEQMHVADACTGTTSRRWLGAPEIRLPRRSTMFRVNRGRFVSAYEGAASDSFDDLAHLGVAEAKQDESSALVPEKW